ncbi:PIN domain-containing protein [Verrucomicrobia bacterium LW23]|nr:PIN domain-containing protein [Verrucomicrobia bacterium LW23]
MNLPPTVVLDACVLYSARVRDLLMELGALDLFYPRCTDMIHDEWIGNLTQSRPELKDKLERTRHMMNQSTREFLVTGFEHLIDQVSLPDADDRHVLAAAITCNARIIVTNNLKDFPADALQPFGIRALSTDAFVLEMIGMHADQVAGAVSEIVARLRNPPQTVTQYLDSLSRTLPQSSQILRTILT